MTLTARRFIGSLFALALSLAASPLTADPDPQNDESASGSKTPPPETTSAEALLEQANEIAERVSSIRGLPLERDVTKGIKDRKELRKSLTTRFETQYGEQMLIDEGDVLKKLGLIGESVDWYQTLVDLMTEQIAGYYDQQSDELFIMRGLPQKMQRPAMAHELFHAVQDQHFNLDSLLAAPEKLNAGDASLALRALIEGDAVVTMIDFFMYERGDLPTGGAKSVADLSGYATMLMNLPGQGFGALEKMAKESSGKVPVDKLEESAIGEAPRVLRELLLFPYMWGMRWVLRMRQGRSWESFNAVYKHPPISTEQILHPKAYARGDDPIHLTYRAKKVLTDYKRIYNTSLGEFQIRQFLQEHLPTSTDDVTDRELPSPANAAAGWDGDRLYGFRDDQGDVAITHVTVWDSAAEANEYHRALETIARKRYPDADIRKASGPHGESLCLRPEDGPDGERVYLERWHDAVLHAEGIPSSLDDSGDETNPAMYRLRDYVWKTLKREPLRPLLEQARSSIESSKKDTSNATDEES